MSEAPQNNLSGAGQLNNANLRNAVNAGNMNALFNDPSLQQRILAQQLLNGMGRGNRPNQTSVNMFLQNPHLLAMRLQSMAGQNQPQVTQQFLDQLQNAQANQQTTLNSGLSGVNNRMKFDPGNPVVQQLLGISTAGKPNASVQEGIQNILGQNNVAAAVAAANANRPSQPIPTQPINQQLQNFQQMAAAAQAAAGNNMRSSQNLAQNLAHNQQGISQLQRLLQNRTTSAPTTPSMNSGQNIPTELLAKKIYIENNIK
ncbi:hypothetical protein HK096_011433, partial [Nowakowskiella sp. JEL0078]